MSAFHSRIAAFFINRKYLCHAGIPSGKPMAMATSAKPKAARPGQVALHSAPMRHVEAPGNGLIIYPNN